MRTLAFTTVTEWHFREPVFIGDTIQVQSKVMAIEPRSRGRRAAISWQRQVLNQQRKIVQEGVVITLVEGRATLRTPKAERGDAENTPPGGANLAG
jgi:3-hydroxybutyryl-CoA dehydratase